MRAQLASFGCLELDGHTYQHDVVIEHGHVQKRKKGLSKPYRDRYGHTPISIDEHIPWSADTLIIGTGADGQLPIMNEVYEEARRRGVKLIAKPTAEACEMLRDSTDADLAAILHVTC